MLVALNILVGHLERLAQVDVGALRDRAAVDVGGMLPEDVGGLRAGHLGLQPGQIVGAGGNLIQELDGDAGVHGFPLLGDGLEAGDGARVGFRLLDGRQRLRVHGDGSLIGQLIFCEDSGRESGQQHRNANQQCKETGFFHGWFLLHFFNRAAGGFMHRASPIDHELIIPLILTFVNST